MRPRARQAATAAGATAPTAAPAARGLARAAEAVLARLSALTGLVAASGVLSGLLQGTRLLLGDTDWGRQRSADLLVTAVRTALAHAHTLAWAAAVAAVLAALTALPLLGRALRRRPAVFVSFHHSRQAQAVTVADALSRSGFEVRRLPFDPAAGHQAVISEMQRLQRGADALVCLPGDRQSVVDAEVYAAAVMRQPVVFVVAGSDGSLPNAADKRYPVMNGDIAAGFGWAPLAELLHHVTRDARATAALYRRAATSRWLGLASAPLRALLLLVLLAVLATLAVDGGATLLKLPVPALLQTISQRVVETGVLTLGALVVLMCGLSLLLVGRRVLRQLVAARRASLRTGEAVFRRADWEGLIPGLEPGQPLHLSLLEEAPLAHHERPTKPADTRRRAVARPR